ncbi:MAG: hypothetical protein RLN75_02230 [Longimicrobiales bacterium]
MGDRDVPDHLIVGTGHAGIAAANALRGAGRTFEVVDVGFDLPEARAREVAGLQAQDPSAWDPAVEERLFPPQDASGTGVAARLAFGSDFVYRTPEVLDLHTRDCEVKVSHGFGGFGNVWGAAMLPYDQRALRAWPVSMGDMAEAYRRVLEFVPLSGERDDLERDYPLYTDSVGQVRRSPWTEALSEVFGRRRDALARAGIRTGRARLAVETRGGASTCRYCSRCLDGCPYGAIFNPQDAWRRLEGDGVRIHRGQYALSFSETEDGVELVTRDLAAGERRTWRARRLYLATGHLSTARMILRSLERWDEPVRVADSQYFFFPVLAWKGVQGDPQFTLAEMFAEVSNEALSTRDVHMQIYGLNRIFAQTLRSMVPLPMPLGWLERRFFLFQGFLHSEDSGHLELTVRRTDDDMDRVEVRGVPNPRALEVARGVRRLFRPHLRRFGLVPPVGLTIVPPGRSFHAGGSFPMGGDHPVLRSDRVGRPAHFRRTHIVDSAMFSDVAGSSIAFTIMANADRVVRESLALE